MTMMTMMHGRGTQLNRVGVSVDSHPNPRMVGHESHSNHHQTRIESAVYPCRILIDPAANPHPTIHDGPPLQKTQNVKTCKLSPGQFS